MLSLIPLLLGVALVMFVITHMLPADPVRVALGMDASTEQVAAYRKSLHLDDPLWKQYLVYLSHLFRGDLGTSIMSRRPVLSDLRTYFPATLELVGASMLISVALSIPMGVIAAVKRGQWVDRLSQLVSLFAVAMPVFWLGVLLQIVFYADLKWLPAAGRIGSTFAPPPTITGMYTVDALLVGDWALWWDALKHLLLPAFALSNVNIAILTRITRSSMLDVLNEGYVTTARAKGLTDRKVIYGHAFRNALIPIITIGGLRFGELMGGAILTETIFSWPGIGRYAVYSIENVDYSPVIGFTLLATLIYFIVNLVVDLVYGIIDPRVRA